MDAKCLQIISSIEQNRTMNSAQYDYLLNHIEHSGFKNAFYYIMYCIDWQYMYGYSGRLTMFDIIVSCAQEKFQKSYDSFKSLIVNGDTNNIQKSYTNVKSCIKIGLQNKGILDTGRHDRKGIGEFIYNFYLTVVNVDYELEDYRKPYLTGIGLSNRLVHDFFYKFMCAYQLMNEFRSSLVTKAVDHFQIEYDPYFLLHILLRHYPPTKIYYQSHQNPLYAKKIKNGLQEKTPIVAIQMKEGIKPISSDGVFHSSYETRCLKEYKIDILRDDVHQILSTLDSLLPILTKHVNPSSSPAIVYYQHALYGVEFKIDDSSQNIIQIGSFYPLNSEWQKTFGISSKDYNRIINIDAMVEENYSVYIEKPYITKCILFYKLYEHYISKIMRKYQK